MHAGAERAQLDGCRRYISCLRQQYDRDEVIRRGSLKYACETGIRTDTPQVTRQIPSQMSPVKLKGVSRHISAQRLQTARCIQQKTNEDGVAGVLLNQDSD